MLTHIIKRARHYDLNPIICTTKNKNDNKIVELADKLNCLYFRGPNDNKLLRWSHCCDHFNIDKFHTLDADDPFFCGDEMKRSFKLLEKGYDIVEPTKSSSSGGATVGYSLTSKVVKIASKGTKSNTDTEMIAPFLKKIQNLKFVQLPDPTRGLIKNRMTLDYYDDYIFLQCIRAVCGNLATRYEIANFLKKNPQIYKINDFRNIEWKNKQQNKLINKEN